MDTVTISPKFQVVIPKGLRERLKLRSGQKVQALSGEHVRRRSAVQVAYGVFG